MLFNKNDKGNAELKSLIGWLYKSNNFSNISMDIKLAEEDIIKLIGKPVYKLADNHYHDKSLDSGSGSASASFSGSATGVFLEPSNELLDELVEHIQLPVALFAYLSYSENTDVSHEDTGRKVKIDSDSEKMAWEWMLDRDNAAILRKAHKTTDRLITFLENNEDNIIVWKNSDQQKTARGMFIKNAKEFDSVFPIDESRAFYIKVLPFMNSIEKLKIKPVLTHDKFSLIKEALKDGDTSDYDDIIEIIKNAIAPLTMAMALRRLSLKVIPEGVIQNYTSERHTSKASKVPELELMNSIVRTLEADANIQLRKLQEFLRIEAAEESGEDFTAQDVMPENDKDNKFFRT